MNLPALPAASLRHLLRHPAQLALALLGLALGVATIVAVDTATASAQRAFELSLQAVNGAADYQIVGGPAGIDEGQYVQLRRGVTPGAAPVHFAPLVSGYVQLGGRILQLIGTDPFAGAELEADAAGSGAPGGASTTDPAVVRDWLAPGAVALGAGLAAALHLAPGDSLELTVGGVARQATVARLLPGAAFDALILTDIAQAQEWLGVRGRLSRIDLRLPPGAAGARALEGLRRTLPAALELQATRASARETFAMTGAFTTNLKAMSLLALLVGTLLIYGAVSFAVVQRRAIFGVLRALGATGAQVLVLVLAEAAVLGVAGAACGALLGLLLARALVGLVAQTINDLYFVVAVSSVSVPALTLVKALGAGVATALVAALLPALEVARAAPQLALARSNLEQRALGIARRLALASAALALGAGLLVLVSGRSLLAGFVALFLLLIAVAAATPAALRALALGSARVAAHGSAVARLACGEIAGSLSRTGVAVASLGMALTAMIGVAIMVGSFRESLRDWLTQTMRADIYVSAPGSADSPERRLAPELIRALLATPGVQAHSEGRRAVVRSPRGALDLNALSIPAASRGAFRFSAGDPARAWQQFAAGAVLISEPLAWRLALAPHDTLTLTTTAGPRAFAVAGVYREYGNDRGEVLMSLAQYRRSFGD
ncbi:MAG TPA: ABC transporter permease, partial [Steroidobacteraceae bacterium]|nr:ABC transporter permease [Steroidobacteraceae bacterium]